MPSLLSMASGASEGLDATLQRMMEEEKLKQLASQVAASQAETSRHNLATEDNTSRQHQLMSMDTQARIREAAQSHDETSADRRLTAGRGLAESIPGDTPLDPTDPAVELMQKAGLGSLLKMRAAQPSMGEDFQGPMRAGDSAEATPASMIKMRSAAQIEKELADKRANDALARQGMTEAERERHDRAMEGKPGASVIVQTATGPQLVQKGTGVAAPIKDAAGNDVAGPESAQTRNRQDMATAIGTHFDDTKQLLDEAEKKGLLGPLSGRTFTDFLAGKVGSTGNAENDQLLGDLRTSMSMIRSGVASLHGRTGANAGIARDIEKKMDEGHMSHAELVGSLNALKKWVDTYATKPGGQSGTTAVKADQIDLVFDPATGTFKKP